MAESMNLVALDWVRGEIEETLNQTQEALEGYIENPEDVTRLQFCVTYLHQVVGTLKMIEAHGASLLSEEMESLAQAISDKKVSDEAGAVEVLLRAMLQMPQYLARIFSGGRDMAIVLLPLLNDIRAVKNEALLTESSLFNPDVDGGREKFDNTSEETDQEFSIDTVRKIRQLYEIALLGIIKEKELEKNYKYMSLSLAKISSMTNTNRIGILWWISYALIDAIHGGGVECSKAVKVLLGKINMKIGMLLKQDNAEVEIPDYLLKNILFYITKSSVISPRIEAVRQAFKLEDASFPDEIVEQEREKLSGPSPAALKSIFIALLEQLDGIKETLDAFVIGKVDDVNALVPVTETLKQVSDALSVVGVKSVKASITNQLLLLNKAVSAGAIPERSVMLEVAAGLLHAESTLKNLISGGIEDFMDDEIPERLSEPQELVLKECHANLEMVKEGFNTYVKSSLSVNCIEQIPSLLKEVMGALSLLEEKRAAAILQQSCECVEKELISNKKKPEAKELEALADAISAVEYYLEQVLTNGKGDLLLLEVGEERMEWVGYGVPGAVGAFGELKH